MCRECRERFPLHRGLAIPTCITARAWRTCRDAWRDRYLVVSFEVGDAENVPGIPGACPTRNFTYLIRGPWDMATEGPHWPWAEEALLISMPDRNCRRDMLPVGMRNIVFLAFDIWMKVSSAQILFSYNYNTQLTWVCYLTHLGRDANMRQSAKPLIVQIKAHRLSSVKPLSEPVIS